MVEMRLILTPPWVFLAGVVYHAHFAADYQLWKVTKLLLAPYSCRWLIQYNGVKIRNDKIENLEDLSTSFRDAQNKQRSNPHTFINSELYEPIDNDQSTNHIIFKRDTEVNTTLRNGSNISFYFSTSTWSIMCMNYNAFSLECRKVNY